MGNIETKSELPDKASFHILDYGYCRVWKRKLDEIEIMEEYPIYIESEERLKMFENVWPLRTNHNIFVNVYHFAHSQPGTLCSSTAKGSLFTERIPYRLSEFTDIKYPEIVKILRTCIEGYKKLYDNFGVFMIRSTMIGFTEDFRVKVWFHTDLSEPEPENPNCKGLQEMLTSLINAVESTCECLHYNCPKFSEFIVQTNNIYFSKSFDYLTKCLNEYVQSLGINIPHDLKHVKNYFKKPEGWEKFKAKNNYPKLLKSQDDISSESSTIHEKTEKIIETPVKPKLQVELPSPQISKSSSKNYLQIGSINQIGTNNRINSPRLERDSYNQRNLLQNPMPKINPIYSPRNINTHNDLPFQQKESLNSWKSTENIVVNLLKNPHALHRVSTEINEPKPNSDKINLNNPSNECFEEIKANSREIESRKSSEIKNEIFPRKSFELSTATKNADKSFESELSLIEDLETKGQKSTFKQNLNFK